MAALRVEMHCGGDAGFLKRDIVGVTSRKGFFSTPRGAPIKLVFRLGVLSASIATIRNGRNWLVRIGDGYRESEASARR